MSYNNKIITAPVTISDVKNAIGNSSNNLGTLCTSSSINKWAKFKPVIHPDDVRNQGEYNTVDGKAGLNIKYVVLPNATQSTVRALYTDAENWSYNVPTGGANSPYRLGDFRGYQVNSYPPIQSNFTKGVIDEVVVEPNTLFSYPYRCYFPAESADYEGASLNLANNIQFSDITATIEGKSFNLGDGYLACFVANQNDDPIINGFESFSTESLRMCDKPIKSGGNTVYVNDLTTGVGSNFSIYYWLVGGIILLNGNNPIFLSLPYFDNNHYHSVCFRKRIPVYFMSMDVTGWSKYPEENVWHDIHWLGDYAGLPISTNSYLKIRVDVDLNFWSSNTFTFTSKNTRIKCTTTNTTKSCTIYEQNFRMPISGTTIVNEGTLYLGADDLFTMTGKGTRHTLAIQVLTGDVWESIGSIKFEGSLVY